MNYALIFFGQLFVLTLSSKIFQFGLLKDSSWLVVFLPIIVPIILFLLVILIALIQQHLKPQSKSNQKDTNTKLN